MCPSTKGDTMKLDIDDSLIDRLRYKLKFEMNLEMNHIGKGELEAVVEDWIRDYTGR